MHPIQLGNWILILLGVLMVLGGPWLAYRTVMTELAILRQKPGSQPQWFNSGINLVIGIVLFLAGILFVVNNLRGNPLP
jgi:hypothetical protein